jgi:hypothetical protein
MTKYLLAKNGQFGNRTFGNDGFNYKQHIEIKSFKGVNKRRENEAKKQYC